MQFALTSGRQSFPSEDQYDKLRSPYDGFVTKPRESLFYAQQTCMSVNPQEVTGRRELRFTSVAEIVADAEQVTRGTPVCLGNWSAGQIMMHLARTVDASIDGASFQVNVFRRLLARCVFKRKMFAEGLPAGFPSRSPLIPGETTIPAGLKGLREAIGRLDETSHREPHPAFGPLSVEEWNQFHCRHAELHLSFILPEADPTQAPEPESGPLGPERRIGPP